MPVGLLGVRRHRMRALARIVRSTVRSPKGHASPDRCCGEARFVQASRLDEVLNNLNCRTAPVCANRRDLKGSLLQRIKALQGTGYPRTLPTYLPRRGDADESLSAHAPRAR